MDKLLFSNSWLEIRIGTLLGLVLMYDRYDTHTEVHIVLGCIILSMDFKHKVKDDATVL